MKLVSHNKDFILLTFSTFIQAKVRKISRKRRHGWQSDASFLVSMLDVTEKSKAEKKDRDTIPTITSLYLLARI